VTGYIWLALRLVPEEPDQVLRLASFREQHPSVSSASTRPPSATAGRGRRSGSRKPATKDQTPQHPSATRNLSSLAQEQPEPRQITR
jgi:hypothetical protein